MKKKKPGKPKAGENETEEAETKGVKNKKDFDDRFYDLDDNFIDDGEMEDGYGAGLNGMGADTYMNEDFYQDRDEDTTMNVQSSMNMEYDPIADAKKEAENEEKRYKQILKRFRVIRPEEVNKMLNDQETNKPSGMINQDGS